MGVFLGSHAVATIVPRTAPIEGGPTPVGTWTELTRPSAVTTGGFAAGSLIGRILVFFIALVELAARPRTLAARPPVAKVLRTPASIEIRFPTGRIGPGRATIFHLGFGYRLDLKDLILRFSRSCMSGRNGSDSLSFGAGIRVKLLSGKYNESKWEIPEKRSLTYVREAVFRVRPNLVDQAFGLFRPSPLTEIFFRGPAGIVK